jgi:hypothetical protein
VTDGGLAEEAGHADEVKGRMSDLGDDLKATAEAIAADAEELRDVEEEKTQLEPEDPETARLTREAERIGRRIVPKILVERQINDELDEAAEEGRPPH